MPPLPPLTKWLMLSCAAVFLIEQLLASVFPLSWWFALWPIETGRFYPWQLVSYAFLHGNLSHLMFNMLGVWMFGAELERLWGQQRFWQLLLASVLTAAAAQLLLNAAMGNPTPTIGASGAVFGLLLAYAMLFPRRQFDLVGFLPMILLMIPNQILNTVGIVLFVLLLTNRQMVPIPPMPVAARTMVIIYGAIELFLGVAYTGSGVAHFAHLGGMLGAWLMIRFWRGQAPFPSRRRR